MWISLSAFAPNILKFCMGGGQKRELSLTAKVWIDKPSEIHEKIFLFSNTCEKPDSAISQFCYKISEKNKSVFSQSWHKLNVFKIIDDLLCNFPIFFST